MKHDPIEGDYRVVGEKPRPQPVVKSWRALAWFLGLVLAAIAAKTLSIIYL